MGLLRGTAGCEEAWWPAEGHHENRKNDGAGSAAKLVRRHGIALTVLIASLAGTFLAWLAARVAVDPIGLGAGRLTLGESVPVVSYPTVVLLGGLCISGMLAVIALLGDRRRRELERKVSTMARYLENRAAPPPPPVEISGASDRYALAVQAVQDGLWDWNLRTDRIDYSPRWKALIGFEEADLTDRPREWLHRVHPEDRERLRTTLDEHLGGASAYFESEHRLLHRDGSYRLMLSRGVAIRDESGRATRVAGSQTDVTAQRKVEERLVHAALHDTLTGLPNRKLFMEKLAVVGKLAARQEGYRFALLFLDVDRFKLINDSLGPAVGDELLVEVSLRLRRAVRPGDTMARLGGDEFAVLLDDIREETEATQIAGVIQTEMAAPFELSGRQVFTGVSIGITFNSNPDQQAEDLVRNADTAMSRAKENGQAGYKLFDKGMHERAVERLRVETELRHALDRDEFLIYYQPVMDMASGKITGCEALLRWEHPERGLVLPREFIPVAEETGLIVPVSEWLLDRVCHEIASFERAGLPPLQVSVNVSPRQFFHHDVLEVVNGALESSGLDPTRLQLEITESALVGNADHTVRPLVELFARGVQIALDDFGTGYSSLEYLRQFPISVLKLSDSFTRHITSNPGDAAIATGLIALGHSLDLKVIVEGVETREQLEFLSAKRCDGIQGHLISPPLAIADLRALLGQPKAFWVTA